MAGVAAPGALAAAAGGIEARLGAIKATLQTIQIQLQALGAADVAQRRAAARRMNSAAAAGVPFVMLPLDDGTAPLAWPAGLDRKALRTLSNAAAAALLGNFGLVVPAPLDDRRKNIAAFIGAEF